METSVNFSVTPLQAILAIAFQAWLVIFPIILMRKIDRMSALLEEKLGTPAEDLGRETEE